MNIGMRGSKGKISSLIQDAVCAKMGGIPHGVPPSAKRWANSAEGKRAIASRSASKKSMAGAKNRAALDAALKPESTSERNRATPSAYGASSGQSVSQKNRAALNAAMEW
jgi:hypothetical protein